MAVDTGFDDGEEQLMAGSDEVPPIPVTPSAGTERPEGLAFDVEKGADLSGVPVGEQTPADADAAAHIEATVRERGGGPPAGLAVPEYTQPPGDDPSDRH